MKSKFQPTKEGYYGQFGGAFIPELLYPNVKELEDNYLQILESSAFQEEYKYLLQALCWSSKSVVFSKTFVRKIWCNYLFKTRRFKSHRRS